MDTKLEDLIARDSEILLDLYGTIENLGYRYAYVVGDPDPIAMAFNIRNWLYRIRINPSWQGWAILVGLIALRPQLISVDLEFNVYEHPKTEDHRHSMRATLWHPDPESHSKLLDEGYVLVAVLQATSKHDAVELFKNGTA